MTESQNRLKLVARSEDGNLKIFRLRKTILAEKTVPGEYRNLHDIADALDAINSAQCDFQKREIAKVIEAFEDIEKNNPDTDESASTEPDAPSF